MKKSLLALAVSLVAVSGAHAAWDPENGVSALNGNGELLLVGWDSAKKVSVYQDTGLKYYDFQGFTSSSYTTQVALSSLFTSTFASSNASDLHWSLFASSNGANVDLAGPNVAFTTNVAPASVAAVDFNAVNSMSAFALTLAANINGTDHNYATNNSILGTAANGLFAGDDANYGTKFGTASPLDVTAGFGTALAFYGTDGSDNSGIQTALSTWKLNLAAGTLTYGSAAPTVPVPAAAWLMGSALAGLGAVARRRRA